ncbi:MAG: carbohydrate kinase [Sphaerobacter sp.]|nr:carbohydrate kinase [Sphaerobacter sp.]
MAGPAPVLCLGEILIDLIGQPAGPADAVEAFIPRVGGAPANVAVALARLGIPAAFLGAVADGDPFAPVLTARLAAEGVDTRWVVAVPDGQTRVAIVTGPAGRRDFAFYGHPPADTCLTPEHVGRALAQGAAALYLSSLPLTAEPACTAALEAVAAARRAGIPVCFDPNPRPQQWGRATAGRGHCLAVLRAADVVKVSRHDLAVLGIDEGDYRTLTAGARLRVLTDGAAGCTFWLDGVRGHQPAFPVASVDETGAGDAFMAALIARGVRSGFRYRAADVRFAAAAGALTTTRLGAIDALPTPAEIAALLDAPGRDRRDRPSGGIFSAG